MTTYSDDNKPIKYAKTVTIDTQEKISYNKNLPDIYESESLKERMGEMENNRSRLAHYRFQKREVSIIKQKQKVIEAVTRYNWSVGEGKRASLPI